MTALEIALSPARFDDGPDYEKVAFGQLEIKAAGESLTALIRRGHDGAVADSGPYISGYHLAEWLVWNWWRLRWEPRPFSDNHPPLEWSMAHRMSDIGEGYRWPNITIATDGYQCALSSVSTNASDSPFLHYLGARDGRPITIPAMELESAVDGFVAFVLERLNAENFGDTDLQATWNDLCLERSDPEISRFRRLEALLGFDPDEKGDAYINNLLKGSDRLGAGAVDELATGVADNMLSVRQIEEANKSFGFEVNLNDAFHLAHPVTLQWGAMPAWRVGVAAAKAVRAQAGLSYQPIANCRLSDLAGISNRVIESDRCTGSLSWVFDPPQGGAQVALRPRWATGRRFDTARLVGDRLFSKSGFIAGEPLWPATRSYSYRQKAQRAFAAELLSPWEAVQEMLGNDCSIENQEQLAEHFAVSPLTISTMLVNNESDRSGDDVE